MQGLGDLTTENEDGVSVMTFLRSVYAKDWQNLLERLKPALGPLDPRYVSEDDFNTGGPLYDQQLELLLWASYRGQLLARTVRGESPLCAHGRALLAVPGCCACTLCLWLCL